LAEDLFVATVSNGRKWLSDHAANKILKTSLKTVAAAAGLETI
jgi:hypothetical protein